MEKHDEEFHSAYCILGNEFNQPKHIHLATSVSQKETLTDKEKCYSAD